MLPRTTTGCVLLLGVLSVQALPSTSTPLESDLDRGFATTVKPFLESYCISCHSGEKPKAQFDLSPYSSLSTVVNDHAHWALVQEKLVAKEMPPEKAKAHPTAEARQAVIDWIDTVRKNEARKNAGDPGIVLARRLSNAEYNYTIRDLTGQDIKPTREFPVDPANQAGFDNSGESLAMSPALLTKYLQAAREVANHLVLKPNTIAFAPHPMLVETDRDRYCVNQIMDFYRTHNTDYADYFQAAWQYKHRAALGKPKATLADVAAENKVSPKYLATVWRALEETKEDVGPGAKLQSMWRELPKGKQPEVARTGCERMRDYVVELRAKLEPRFRNLAAGSGRGLGATSQPFLMWKNRQYASHRMLYDRGALQVEGEKQTAQTDAEPAAEPGAENEFGPGATMPVKNKPGDPDLAVPAGRRAQYEAAFTRFCAVFPDAFYVAERGRNYLDKTKDKGRYLSAGFHNVMGYFRDDQPFYELILDEKEQRELDAMWQDLDYVALGCNRTFVQFFLNEAREARSAVRGPESGEATPEDKEITSDAVVKKIGDFYVNRVRASSNAVAIKAVEDHFKSVNDTIRWVEKTKADAEPKHLAALQDFAARAFRRELTSAEREGLIHYYRSVREKTGLDHDDAMRDSIVYVLMSPDFCYRIDLVEAAMGAPASRRQPSGEPAGETPVPGNARALSDYALASRLSYFLWSSMPDAELLAAAKAGNLHQPEVLAAQARRMLKDERVRGLAVEFGGNWLDFRRFEELNTVDRERFTSFDNDLRQAMFEEPIEFMLDVFRENRSVLDFVYANHTFVNPALARHYGMPPVDGGPDHWVRVADAGKYGRGGLLPMSAFLTKNAPGLRTSPVKRGYWVVKRVLGEHIPPPPAAVPELPRDEAKMDLPLRDTLARHREDPSCSACHSRFDSLGLVFEGYGPIGEKRDKDLAGRPVDVRATFPGGTEGDGFEGVRKYIREHRQDDFIDGLSRKLLTYALGRTLMLSDDLTIEQARARLAKDGYRFDSLIESIVTSPQFLTKRGRDEVAQR